MCLVAVGKDGNNNIYPVAWAVVEVENADTWRWFIELLSSDIGREDGEGMTFMSDRQKGLIDALKYVVPKAEIRFCVRHIWANFKLSFGGQVFKDAFWMAARANTKAAFDSHMEEIKSLSNEAWTYLNAIPTKHWSRHAFGTTSKSNMLLNNLCETFNAVLKDARDKPILTHMEWMRRYVMKRNCGKREGVVKYEGRLMPYADKYIKWARDESRHAVVSSANEDKYEVDLKGKTWRVNLKEHTCDCNHWNLTGLPCPHAMGVILDQRLIPEDFVDEAYTKMRYVMAYEPVVSPMPGVHEWEKTNMPEPLPPPLRKMPGRPSAKKRRREAGEEQSKYVKRPKRANKCSHCGHAGHSKRTCKNPPAPPKPTNVGGRPESTSEWAKEGRLKATKRRAEREKYASAHLTSSTSQATSAIIHNPNTEMPSQSSLTIPSWARE